LSVKLRLTASLICGLVLIFLCIVREYLLDAMQIPLSAFSIAGGINFVFCFATDDDFLGESKTRN